MRYPREKKVFLDVKDGKHDTIEGVLKYDKEHKEVFIDARLKTEATHFLSSFFKRLPECYYEFSPVVTSDKLKIFINETLPQLREKLETEYIEHFPNSTAI